MKNNCEIVGILSEVETGAERHKLIFTMMKAIEIPYKAIPVEKLKELEGQRIGILNIDGKYRIRKISK